MQRQNIANWSSTQTNTIIKNIQRLLKKQQPFIDSINAVFDTCVQIKQERDNHIKAIEIARNKKMYDCNKRFVDDTINNQGKEEFVMIIHNIKKEVFGASQTKKMVFSILRNIQQIRNEEWCNAKNHHICIGKYASVVRMVNPKKQSGPVTGRRLYPTKPGEPIRRALNDTERKDASNRTHKLWIDNPPGRKKCHFLDIINDDIGPHGVSVNPNKKFETEAEWNNLEGQLSEKVNEDIANRIMAPHQKLP